MKLYLFVELRSKGSAASNAESISFLKPRLSDVLVQVLKAGIGTIRRHKFAKEMAKELAALLENACEIPQPRPAHPGSQAAPLLNVKRCTGHPQNLCKQPRRHACSAFSRVV